MTRALTPYDRGEVLEPSVWVDPETHQAGTYGQRPAEKQDWGRVDFNNDETATEAVVWMKRGEDGVLELHFYSMGDDEIRVVNELA